MATFVLVHGAWHGAWCWDHVVPGLGRAGHEVIAFDLPGHGEDRTPLGDVTLERYAERTAEVIAGAGEPVVLVGHSMGGAVVSEAAERVPDAVARLVYVAGYLLPSGTSVVDANLDGPAGVLTSETLAVSEDGASMTVRPEHQEEAFYGCCDPGVARWATARLIPQAVRPLVTPVRTSADRWGAVPRAYVATVRDRAIVHALQQRMLAAIPCDPVITIDTDHSPFLSAPAELTDALLSLAP